ncbi:dihydroorotase [Flagellatimonas centrodinii]|uniref:dihydroorotase n=1 Tax=Flagellatimonas centrodinii TaxID=2806210 RepID=UPI001FEE69BB|nr:dihydroorotase [Flagellatimonas centrodinii]ULQ46847.1 dihydroorotase [Flagellatimonas centrodinii]
MSILIRNARLLDPARGLDVRGHLGLRNRCITHFGDAEPVEPYDEVLEADGQWIVPGAVDLCARFREPGDTGKADFASETRAAFAGGITRFALPPDTRPPLDTPAMVVRVLRISKAVRSPWVAPLGALTRELAGNALAEMSALKAAGCVGLSNALRPLQDPLLARRALEYAHGLGLTIHVFPQDPALAGPGCAHEGPVATRLGLAAIPVAAEVAALRFWISLVEDTGARVHFGRLSTARGVELVETARDRGLPITADVAAHQLFLTEDLIDGFNALGHVVPPLRDAVDRDALRGAVGRGAIDAVCSDHQPHEADAKINPFPLTEPGLSTLETLWPLVLQLVDDGVLSPLAAVDRITAAPARILGLPAPTLEAGAAADVVMIDPDADWTLQAAKLLSRGRHTPFEGWRFRHKVSACWHDGVRRA